MNSRNKCCSLSPPSLFLFIVLCIRLMHELGGVLNFLSSLNLGASDRNAMSLCYALGIGDLSVHLIELLL